MADQAEPEDFQHPDAKTTAEPTRVFISYASPDAAVAGALVYHAQHRKADSDAALARLIQASGDTWPYSVATVYAYRGEHNHAIEWLEKALESRDSDLPAFAVYRSVGIIRARC
jgi:tetratricopeptide (TPR) repeat protein